MRVGALSAEHVPDRAERLARLELVRSGVTTAATLAHERTLPVTPALGGLVPAGVLQRGSTLAAHGPGATSLSLALAAEAVRSGSFLAVVAPSAFGLGMCLDFGIPLRRVVQFAIPDRSGAGSEGSAGWAQLVAAVLEGFDLVVLADRHRPTASQARQLVARNRERGSVLFRAGGPAWPDAPDVRYDLHESRWNGLGRGHGHLRERTLGVKIAGRRWHGTDRARTLRLSGEHGAALVEPSAPAAPLQPQVPDRFAGADIDRLLDAVDGGAPAEDAPTRRRFGTVV